MGIYANDGPGGSPGSLLWQSGPLTGLLIPAYSTELTVPVPDITVPDVITVTSQILSSTPIALGRLNALCRRRAVSTILAPERLWRMGP